VPASRRVPLGIPGGLFGDSDAAADHLVRQPKVVLVVDGYNVAKLGWPGLSLELQRESAIASLDDLVRRISTRVIAVFDGADVPPVAARRRLVRVKFSPAGVTADDSIRELIAGLPDKLPVVVATNDQEIVQDVRQMGANVIRSEQLLALLRR
jgi:predicted RNA-binding protein with PIN domain